MNNTTLSSHGTNGRAHPHSGLQISEFLNLREYPARLLAEQVAMFLNCTKENVRTLTAKGLLKPLGRPSRNSVKFYSRADILSNINDQKWLNKITTALAEGAHRIKAVKAENGICDSE